MGTPSIQFEGVLEKTAAGIFTKKMKVRAVLFDTSLTYYKTNKRSSCIGSIDMSDVQRVRRKWEAKVGTQFEIKTPSKAYTFSAESTALCEEWIVVLHKSMKLATTTTPRFYTVDDSNEISSIKQTEETGGILQRTCECRESSGSNVYEELDNLPPASPTRFGVTLKSSKDRLSATSRKSQKESLSTMDSKQEEQTASSAIEGSPTALGEIHAVCRPTTQEINNTGDHIPNDLASDSQEELTSIDPPLSCDVQLRKRDVNTNSDSNYKENGNNESTLAQVDIATPIIHLSGGSVQPISPDNSNIAATETEVGTELLHGKPQSPDDEVDISCVEMRKSRRTRYDRETLTKSKSEDLAGHNTHYQSIDQFDENIGVDIRLNDSFSSQSSDSEGNEDIASSVDKDYESIIFSTEDTNYRELNNNVGDKEPERKSAAYQRLWMFICEHDEKFDTDSHSLVSENAICEMQKLIDNTL